MSASPFCLLGLRCYAVAVILVAAFACKQVYEVDVCQGYDTQQYPPAAPVHIVQTAYRSADGGDNEHGEHQPAHNDEGRGDKHKEPPHPILHAVGATTPREVLLKAHLHRLLECGDGARAILEC